MNEKEVLIEEIKKILPDISYGDLEFVFFYILRKKEKMRARSTGA